MKLRKKSIGLLTMLCMIITLLINGNTAYAAGSFSVSGGGTVSAGASQTITVKTSNCAGQFSVTISGGGSVSTKSIWVDGSTTFMAKAPSSGSATVKVTATDVTDSDLNIVTGSKSVTIKVKEPEPEPKPEPTTPTPAPTTPTTPSRPTTPAEPEEPAKSSNNKLSALKVAEGTLSPSFDAGTTEYTVDVVDAEKVTISASKADSEAKMTGTGEHKVVTGENVFNVVVTAENGTKRTYKIVVNLSHSPSIYLNFGDKELGLVKDVSEVEPPDGFEKTIVKISGPEGEEGVEAWVSNTLGMTILYMIDEEGATDFYTYDEQNKELSEFMPLGILGKNIYVVNIPESEQTREGMSYQTVTIDGNTLNGWAFEDESMANYFVIYVMSDTGNMVNYLYSKEDNSMITQPSFAPVSSETYLELMNSNAGLEDEIKTANDQYNELNQYLHYAKMIAMGLIALVVILLIVIIVLSIKLKKACKAKSMMLGGIVGESAFEDSDYDEELDDAEEVEELDDEDFQIEMNNEPQSMDVEFGDEL